jgi:ubiquitin C-terminal hydrolase
LGHRYKCRRLREAAEGKERKSEDVVSMPPPLVYLYDPAQVSELLTESQSAVDLPPMNKGLVNKGQSCYLNSILQYDSMICFLAGFDGFLGALLTHLHSRFISRSSVI